MSFLDSIASRLRAVNDDMDEDDIEQDGYEDEEDEDLAPRRKGFTFGRKTSANNYDNEPEDSFDPAERPSKRPGSARRGSDTMQVRIIKPSSYDQTKMIADTLLDNRTVLLNLEGLDVNTAQRIVDFTTGACYALHGNFTQMSHFIFVVTPQNVGISGDIAATASASAFKSAKAAAAMTAANGANSGMNGNPYVQNMNGNPFAQE